MRFAAASAPALLSRALEAWERDLDDREAELAAKLLVAPRDAPCTRIHRDAPCTRIDRDAPCTRILWPLDGSSGCPSCSSRVDGCCAVRLLAAGRRTSPLPCLPACCPRRPSTLPTRPSTRLSTAVDAAHVAVDAAVDAAHATVDAAHAGRYGLQSASMAASVCFALGRALLD